MINQDIDISKFITNGKIKMWPSKTKPREALRNYLATKIEDKKIYSEKEINDLLNDNHTFGDPAFLRRELCDHHLLSRDKYGYQYWKK